MPKIVEVFVDWLPNLSYLQYPFYITLYASTIPFYFALFQSLKILSFIDINKFFSTNSIQAFKYIKYSFITISLIFLLDLPLIYLMADVSDAPGIMLIGMAFVFVFIVLVIIISVLQKLTKEAINLLN